MKQARRDRWLVAAGVVAMLAALVVVGRLQVGNLADGDAGLSQPTASTVRTDATPVASGLAVAGRVVLPGRAAAVAVDEDAVWVLLEQGTLLRVDPYRHRVTGRLELEAPTGGEPAGPLAIGAEAVWVGTRGATVTVRVDPVRLRVTGRWVAAWPRWPAGWCGTPAAGGETISWGLGGSMLARCAPGQRWWSPTPRAGGSRSGGLP